MVTLPVPVEMKEFEEILRLVASGQEVVLSRSGEAVARVTPVAEQSQKPPREFGRLRGKITWTGDIVGSDPEIIAMMDDPIEPPR